MRMKNGRPYNPLQAIPRDGQFQCGARVGPIIQVPFGGLRIGKG